MKKIASILLFAISVAFVNAQEKDPVLLNIGGKDVKLSEFNAIYHKNNSNENSSDDSIEEYLDLYIKFKLKVREAEELGYDTLPKFINELKGYRKQLAQPYLTDKDVTESLIKEAYERMKFDVKASHVLIKVNLDASYSDTLSAYKRALKVRQRVMSDEGFDKVANEMSGDPSAQKNGGNLGYFSALHMVYPFETAAYNTPEGKVTMPTRTRFGYHVIKVTDKRPARGMIKVAHIMVKLKKDASEEEINLAKKKIDEILGKITSEGEGFDVVAKQFSEDQGSARRGGELPEFNSGKMVAEFEEAAYALSKDGEMSNPIKTDFGWHIIKRLELKELGSYDELYKTIKAKVARDSRSNKSKEALIKKIKENNMFVQNIKERNDFYNLIKSEEYIAGTFKASKTEKYNKLMFGFYAKDGDKVEYLQTDFSNYLEKNKYRGKNSESLNMNSEIDRHYKSILEKIAIDFKDSRLIKTSDEFRLLMQEYRDGILLFDLTDEKVWSKAVKDSAGLENFYSTNKSKYMWNERVEAELYICSDEAVAKNVAKILKKKDKKGYTNDDILKMVNTESQLALKIEEGKYSKGDNESVDKAIWKNNSISTVNKEKGVVIVKIKTLLNPESKQLNEIKGLITSDYQNSLEKEWVINLKSKYKVEINREVLKLVK